MECNNNEGSKKQKRTYGPMGLSQLRIYALVRENENTLIPMGQVCEGLEKLYEFLKTQGFTDEDCYLTAKRLCMLNLGRYMEEDTNYDEYIVNNHYN